MAAALSAPWLIFDFGHSHYHSTMQNISEQILEEKRKLVDTLTQMFAKHPSEASVPVMYLATRANL